MENFKPIEFHLTRDFSKKINTTFEFLRQNFKPLFKAILFLAGPPILIASLLIGTFLTEFIGLSQGAALNPQNAEYITTYFTSVTFWLQLILMFVFLIVSSVVAVATVNSYIILYGEKKTSNIEVSEVWDRVRATFWMYLGNMILFMILGILAYILLIIPIVLLAAISPFLIFLGFIFIFGAIIYLFFSVSLTFFIRDYEKIGFFESIGRSFRLVQGKWWSTFGLITVLYLIMVTVSYLFMIPMYVSTLISTLHNISGNQFTEPSSGSQIFTIVSFALYYLAQMFLSSLPNIGIAFQYFNLVELKEAKGLLSQLETIGEAPKVIPSPDEQY